MTATCIHEFIAPGSARLVSRAIEAWTATRRGLSALVVPWESDATTLNMALTSVQGDGWAVEHTNLGTIRLVDLGDDRTHVALLAADPGHDQPSERPAVTLPALAALARQIEQTLGTPAEPSR